MKYFDWNPEKSASLEANRGIGFEDVITAIEEGLLLNTILHPNKTKYPGQKIYIVKIDNYCYSVPFVESDDKIFLKTIIPDRKATKKYLKKG